MRSPGHFTLQKLESLNIGYQAREAERASWCHSDCDGLLAWVRVREAIAFVTMATSTAATAIAFVTMATSIAAMATSIAVMSIALVTPATSIAAIAIAFASTD